MANSTPRTRGRTVPFRYLQPAKRKATQYEEVTVHVQWDPKNFAAQGWFNRDCNGRPAWDTKSTALKAEDWWGYRDPNEEWFRPFVSRQAEMGSGIERAIQSARRARLFDDFMPKWREFLATNYSAYRFSEYGLFMALCYAQREALSDVVASPLVFQGMEKDRHAQDIALYGMELESAVEGFSDENCKAVWLESPIWQPTREVVELLMGCRDWGEINFVINMLFEPVVAALFNTELVLRFAPRHGDSVTPVIAAGAEADREFRQRAVIALAQYLVAQDAGNATVMQSWLSTWTPRVFKAAHALAPLFSAVEVPVQSFEGGLSRVVASWHELLAEARLKVPQGVAA
jgi:hypothetical protein